jgi:predicted signal transduction protein with EAL and GGDEF domain
VGVTGRDHAHATVEQLLHEADWAVYHAKAAGRGRVVTYNEDSHLDKTGSLAT